MRKKKVPLTTPEQQRVWTRSDVFFGDKFNDVQGAVHLRDHFFWNGTSKLTSISWASNVLE